MSRILTNKGLEIITSRIKGIGTEPVYIAWGTGSGTLLPINTTLFSEDTTAGYERIAGTSSLETIDETKDTYVVTGALTAKADLVITEWGLFDAISAGNMLAKETYPSGYEVLTGGTINFTFRFQIERAQ